MVLPVTFAARKLNNMAKPIKETPILTGRDAVVFTEKLRASSDKKATPQEIAKMKENFSRLQSITK